MVTAQLASPRRLTPTVETKSLKIILLSSMGLPWGGSEELWHSAARSLAAEGHHVSVIKDLVDFNHPKMQVLKQCGIEIDDYRLHQGTKAVRWMMKFIHRYLPLINVPGVVWLRQKLRRIRPDLVIIAQGGNFDGLDFITVCREQRVKYALICQKASDQNWPCDSFLDNMRDAFIDAQRVFFVSRHNHELTELQIGVRLPKGEVVRNPVNMTDRSSLPWPSEDNGFRLACVGRLVALEKGQDILLRVLARQKWRQRSVHVTFFGEGEHEQALRGMAALLELNKVKFGGFSSDISSVWKNHHALVLPSRAEGLPLALVEAMICGRPAITTRVGGAEEIVRDNVNGFLAQSASEDSVDEALERAWVRRHEWQEIGKTAHADAIAFLPQDPGLLLARKFQDIALPITCKLECAESETIVNPITERLSERLN